jgi:hypothetical protein
VSSGDDLKAKERRALQEATEAVGFFGVLEQQCANAADQPEADLGPMRSAVIKKLEKAETLLGEGSDTAAIIDHLRIVFTAAEEINYRLILQNRMHIEFDLLTPGTLRELADEALEKARTCQRENRSEFSLKLSELRVAMRRDLPTSDAANFKELDSAAHAKIGTQARGEESRQDQSHPATVRKT